ncbi:MAG TPA: rod shape-determining protein RodA [Nitrolancea sp.]|nr:rod shape-determining protein RodA [Nitrolancea sp.]
MGTLITSLGVRRQATALTLDLYLIVTTAVLIGFGLIAIWSADGGGPLAGNLVVRQALYVLIGIPVVALITSIDYRYLQSLAWLIYAGTLAMLTLVTLMGTSVAGGTRWIMVGPITFQPSEIAKLGVIIALAAFIADRGEEMRRFVNFVLAGVLVAVPMALVERQPDLGTASVFAFIWLVMILMSRARLRYLLGLILCSPVVALVGWRFLLHDFQRERLLISYHPERDYLGAGYNIIQAQITIGSGGFLGHGLAGSSQSQLDLLRVRTTDFIFAHAMGMFGFIGAVALYLTYAILIWRALQVVGVARDNFGQLVAVGIAAMIFFQVFINTGMNMGIMPVTGIPLPFITFGGSSLWTLLAGIGLLQSIRIHHQRLGFQPE